MLMRHPHKIRRCLGAQVNVLFQSVPPSAHISKVHAISRCSGTDRPARLDFTRATSTAINKQSWFVSSLFSQAFLRTDLYLACLRVCLATFCDQVDLLDWYPIPLLTLATCQTFRQPRVRLCFQRVEARPWWPQIHHLQDLR